MGPVAPWPLLSGYKCCHLCQSVSNTNTWLPPTMLHGRNNSPVPRNKVLSQRPEIWFFCMALFLFVNDITGMWQVKDTTNRKSGAIAWDELLKHGSLQWRHIGVLEFQSPVTRLFVHSLFSLITKKASNVRLIGLWVVFKDAVAVQTSLFEMMGDQTSRDIVARSLSKMYVIDNDQAILSQPFHTRHCYQSIRCWHPFKLKPNYE